MKIQHNSGCKFLAIRRKDQTSVCLELKLKKYQLLIKCHMHGVVAQLRRQEKQQASRNK